MQENRVGLIISFISLGCVVLMVIAFGNLYQKQRAQGYKISDLGRNSNFTNPSLQYLQQKVDALDSRLNNGVSSGSLDRDSYTYSQLHNIENLLVDVASDYFLKENSTVVNGKLRVSLPSGLIFSADIPASVYREYPNVHYSKNSGSGYFDKSVYMYRGMDALSFYPRQSRSGDIVLGSLQLESYQYGLSSLSATSTVAACSGNYSEDILVAGAVIRQMFEHQTSRNWFDDESFDEIDFCKYVIPHKNLNLVEWSWIGYNDPDLLNPTLYTGETGNWKGYTFDTFQFDKDTKKGNDGVPNNIPALFVAIPQPNKSNEMYYNLDPHVIQLHWYPGLYPDADLYKENKAAFDKAEQVLETTIKSIADSAVLLPLCEYGCAY